MKQFEFVVATVQKVGVQAETQEQAREWLEQQLPHNATIEEMVEVEFNEEKLQYTMRNIMPRNDNDVSWETVLEEEVHDGV